MKRTLATLIHLAVCGSVFAAPQATFFNAGVITNAIPIDAITFVNFGTFTNIFTAEFPYDMSNVRYFTNNGSMSASVGFQLDTVSDTFSTPPRRPLTSFFNGNGARISGEDSFTTFFGFGNGVFFGSGGSTASFLKISATNLVSRGSLSVGTVGLLQLTGKNVDLARSAVSAGQVSTGNTNLFVDDITRGFTVGNQYVNAFGVEDLYYGAGPFVEDFRSPDFSYFPPNVTSPLHAIQYRSTAFGGIGGIGGVGGIIGTSQRLPVTFPASFEAFTFVNQVGTNKEIQVVFLKTNFTDTNISYAVRFGNSSIPASQLPGNRFGSSAIVEFSTPELDSITGEMTTNAIYFIDSSAEQNSIVLLNNALSVNGLSRPSGYEIATATPFEWIFAQPTNTEYDPFLIYPGDVYMNKAISGFYGAYSAQVGRNPEQRSGTRFNNSFTFFSDNLILPDPTNQPGRIEINADRLDLTLSRIRTEGLLTMNAKHLAGGGAADVSAGLINADLGSTNGSLVISNIFPSHFRRVRGDLFAWSAIWNNVETNAVRTNNVMFHILILDHDLKADFTPTVQNLTLRSTNLIFKDTITVNRAVKFEAENLTFDGSVTLAEGTLNLHADGLVGVKNFLNESNSIFQGANDAYFGYDTPKGYESIINRGMISAVAPLFKATNFVNSGTIAAVGGGSTLVESKTAMLSDGRILADRNIYITSGDLTATNSIIVAGNTNSLGQPQFGQLILTVTNLLSDFGEEASNFWQVTDGFSLPVKPKRGDLLGTEIRTIAAGISQESQHVWAGEDRGPGPAGFSDNVAIGHLILDVRNTNAILHFSGAGERNGLYVYRLDFNVTTNVDIDTSLATLLSIKTNLHIYFVESNAGDKLSSAFPGQIVKVSDPSVVGGSSSLVVVANGLGIVAPNLNGKSLQVGASYKVKATPAKGYVFAGWSGGTNSSSASLSFKMKRNLVLQANFPPNPFDPVVGSYSGLFFDAANGARHESSGYITFTVTAKGTVSGRVISGKTYSFTGSFNPSGQTTISVVRRGFSSLALNLQLDLTDYSDQVHGTLSDGSWTAAFNGDRARSGFIPAAKYTMVITGGDSVNHLGDGYGTVTLDAAGRVKFSGVLADGTRVSQQATVSKNGKWPFYAPLYSGAGSIFSWVSVDDKLDGNVNWFRRGYSVVGSEVIGSKFVKPASGASALAITNGSVILNEGNLKSPITNATILQNNRFQTTGTNRLTVSVNLASGLLTGSFLHPDTRKTTAIKGVVLQQQNSGRGFFLGTNQSGSLLLEGN